MKTQTDTERKSLSQLRTARIVILLILSIMAIVAANAQELTQTIRGTVLDEGSQIPAIGANVIILKTNPIMGSSTDLDGTFRIDNVPVGRVDLKITCLGYEEKVLANVLVNSGKEVVLHVTISESVETLNEVNVTATRDKTETVNEMATVSAKAVTVEETKRYAGAINDPARMVSSFAGVSQNPFGNNDIIVRGNSPRGVQWRMEGIEIPNPNHFVDEGATGGPINALNSNMLSNSDFFTGAFAPEYGNAYSGVFDMKLRNGNNQRREYSFSAGILGTDFTAEGPISVGSGASYLVNYRYSTLAILDAMKMVDFQGVPKYQDASFKVVIPTEKLGVFSVFGLGGISSILQKDEDEDENIVYYTNEFSSKLGIVGVKNTFVLNDKTWFRNIVSYSRTYTGGHGEKRNESSEYFTEYTQKYDRGATRFSSTMFNKLNSKHQLQSGLIYTLNNYDMALDFFNYETNRQETVLSSDGYAGMIQAYTSWKYRLNKDLTLVSGLHYTQLFLNNNNSLEPRVSLKYQLTPKQSLTAGFGIHSKTETLSTYLAKSTDENGIVTNPNKDLGLAKARHYVIGYSNMFTDNLNLKAEIYYQDLFNVPVMNDINNSLSVLNSYSGFLNEELVNKGSGTNYGAELTLERFFARSYYFLITASVYESKYKALDGVSRKTMFDGNYAGNVLAGKEFAIGKPEKGRTIGVNVKASIAGGVRYTPIDLEQSIASGYEVRQENKPFSVKGDDIFNSDIAFSLRRNKNRTTRELKLEFRNVTNSKTVVYQFYNSRTQEIESLSQSPFMPLISYKIDF